ncbi:hypothetical protein LCGC14_0779930 [marine sediment metagenome]|uniref:Uncharacterized protein n=1 Tax=marine sediment metagenome TaxID=412755 RepID=A0A0F9Q023_9ZZZZ
MLRYLGLAVLILSILGSQIGIAIIVTEWRQETPIEQSIPKSIDSGPSREELDVRKCEAALEAAGDALGREPRSITDRVQLSPNIPPAVQTLIDRYC